MVDIARLGARRRAAHASQLAVDRHQVDHRTAGAQLHQADFILTALDRAAQHLAIKTHHALQPRHAQHDMVDFTNVNHVHSLPNNEARL